MTNEEKIQKLTELWMRCINDVHHKSRDCYFYIGEVYSYGEPVKYVIAHDGYVAESFEITATTQEEGQWLLIHRLVGMIETELITRSEENDDYTDNLPSVRRDFDRLLGLLFADA